MQQPELDIGTRADYAKACLATASVCDTKGVLRCEATIMSVGWLGQLWGK